MKKISLTAIIISVLLISCTKNSTNLPPVIPKGTPTPKGSPIGNAITKTIGPSGGTISSTNSGITVIVPAGAVSGSTEFSIQPITNTVPNGIATSYLLLPEGKHFDKPVSIQLKYTDDDLDGTSPENLFLAYQDSTGIWHAKNDTRVDSVTKTLTVTSDHFSRWAGFADIFLTVDNPSIDVNESSHLRVRKVTQSTEEPQPLTGEKILDTTYPSKIRVENWSLIGGGTIEGSLTVTGTYTAPPTLPSPNPVTVTASIADIMDFDHIHRMSLKRKIYVHSSFLEIVMDGETNIYPTASIEVKNSFMSVRGYNSKGNGATFVMQGSGTGSYKWGTKGIAPGDIQVSIGGVQFSDIYFTCPPNQEEKTTEGTVNITKWADLGGYVEGTFSGSIVVPNSDCKNPIIKSISGRFKAKRY